MIFEGKKQVLVKRREVIKAAAILASGAVLEKTAFSQITSSKISKLENSSSSAIERFGDGRDWFFKKRFGLFVHWGLYAIPAWHEQVQQRTSIPREQYEKLSKKWNPAKFNPERWLDLMQDAGMEYITFTCKHLL